MDKLPTPKKKRSMRRNRFMNWVGKRMYDCLELFEGLFDEVFYAECAIQ